MAKLSRTAKCPKCGGSLHYIHKMASKAGLLRFAEKTIVKKGKAMYRRIWWCKRCGGVKTPLYYSKS